MPSILDRALNVGEAKKRKSYEKRVALIGAFEPELEHESNDELRERKNRQVPQRDQHQRYRDLHGANGDAIHDSAPGVAGRALSADMVLRISSCSCA